jgi:predicted MFS family arabinose efflux permease
VLCLGFARSYPVAAALVFTGGLSMVLFTSTNNSFVQMQVPDELRGRVMSVHTMLFVGSTPLGAMLTGGVMDLWGPAAGFLTAGSLGLLAVAAVGLWARRAGAHAGADRRGEHIGA